MWIESKNTIKRLSCHVSGTEKRQPSFHLWCEKHQRVDDDGFGLNFLHRQTDCLNGTWMVMVGARYRRGAGVDLAVIRTFILEKFDKKLLRRGKFELRVYAQMYI